jgi:hypothetical protein
MKTRLLTCALAALALAAAGCSGSSPRSSSAVGGGNGGATSAGNGGSGPAGGGLPTTPAEASKAVAGLLAGAGGALDVSKLCAAVKPADVQQLFKGTAPPVTANPGECDWGGGGITLDIYANDASKQYYNGGGLNVGTATPLPGVGDEAAWSQPVPGATVPVIAAHKGSTTCTITPGLNVDETTMSYTGTDPFYKIDPASASQYAVEEGQLCNEIFAALPAS